MENKESVFESVFILFEQRNLQFSFVKEKERVPLFCN